MAHDLTKYQSLVIIHTPPVAGCMSLIPLTETEWLVGVPGEHVHITHGRKLYESVMATGPAQKTSDPESRKKAIHDWGHGTSNVRLGMAEFPGATVRDPVRSWKLSQKARCKTASVYLVASARM